MTSWKRRTSRITRECFIDEDTGSERLSDCLGSHSNLRRELSAWKNCGGALEPQPRTSHSGLSVTEAVDSW